LTRYLLDTNIISDLVRNPEGRPTRRVDELDDGAVCTSIIVVAEIRYGLARRRSPRLARQMEEVLAAMEILPFEPPADSVYGELRARLEATGTLIGANDLFIAAHAKALNLTLVTDNVREFGRVDGLQVENWLRGG